MEERRRRARVIRIFPNEASAQRRMGAGRVEWPEKWAAGQRYFAMEDYHEAKCTAPVDLRSPSTACLAPAASLANKKPIYSTIGT